MQIHKSKYFWSDLPLQMPSIWDLVSYFVALGGTLHSTYDLLLQHDVVIAGELGVREAGPRFKNQRVWSIEVYLCWGKDFSFKCFLGFTFTFKFPIAWFFESCFSFNPPNMEGNWDDANETGPCPRIFFRGWNHVVKSRPVFVAVLGDEILPSIMWELFHQLIRHEIRIPFLIKYFKSMSLQWVLNSHQISLKNKDVFFFFGGGGWELSQHR